MSRHRRDRADARSLRVLTALLRRLCPRGRGAAVGALIIGLACGVWAWAASSPVGASPDEGAHIVYSWGTATGQTLPWTSSARWDSEEQRTLVEVTIPRELDEQVPRSCYRTKPMDEGCAVIHRYEGSRTATTYMDRYPLVYYAVIGETLRMSLGAGLTGSSALIVARVVSGAMSALVLLAAGRVLLRRFPASPVVSGLVIPMTPMGWFLSASINPNGLEWTLAMLLAALVLAACSDARWLGRVSGPVGWSLGAVTLLLSWTRPVSVVWAGAIILVLLLRSPGRGARPVASLRRGQRAAVVVALALGVAWFLYQASGSTEDVSTTYDGGEWTELPVVLRLWMILSRFGYLLQAGFGLLGWADTWLPLSVFLLWLVVAVAVVVRMSSGSHTGGRVVAPSTIAMVAAVGALAVVVESYSAGFGWQGRYWYPSLASVVVLLVGVMIPGGPVASARRWGTRSASLVVVVGVAGEAVGLLYNLWRYEYGYHKAYERFETLPYAWRHAVWAPAGGDGLFCTLAIIGLLLVTAGLLGLVWGAAASEASEVAPAPGAAAGAGADEESDLPTGDGASRDPEPEEAASPSRRRAARTPVGSSRRPRVTRSARRWRRSE